MTAGAKEGRPMTAGACRKLERSPIRGTAQEQQALSPK
eukprot:CAMPEP_0115072228 /NCGR_PEP_ID=MMETSP0227-20121206/14111_1 /TAXON_ID=89957 /ORGANISM="Polarella glacialis, Strain CCMP 1383" /LENGTH=37 /DNA_ID= /DNA_START= /DNA_END= /DNA_ORIENTATION=